jgi:uncharacterized membrane protein YbhN (UPF0104 family)
LTTAFDPGVPASGSVTEPNTVDPEATEVAPVSSRRSSALGWMSVLCSVVVLGASVALVDARQVIAQLEAADAHWLLAYFVTYVIELGLLGLRWSNIARQLHVPLGWRRASAEYSLSMLVNQLLPTGVAGDGLRAVRHARRCRSRSFSQILEALALDRLSGQLGLGLMVLASLPLSLRANLVDGNSLLWALGAVVALVLGMLCLLALLPRLRLFLAPAQGFVGRAARLLLSPRRAAGHLPLSLLLVCGLLLQLYFAARAVGVTLDLQLLCWLGSLVLLAGSVPSFFGGWGVREGASALLFASAGFHGSTGVAVSLVFGAFALVCALPGAVVLLWDALNGGR